MIDNEVSKPIGDIIIWISVGITIFAWCAGWVVLILISLLQMFIPRYEYELEEFLQATARPVGFLQKYGIYVSLILIACRFVAQSLGWAPAMFPE